MLADVLDSLQQAQMAARDLEAQQSMARAAWCTIGIGICQVILTVVSIWYFIKSLKLTRQAVLEAAMASKAANDSAVATQASLQLQKETAAIQLRPWISVSLVRGERSIRRTETGVYFEGKLIIENHGDSPAMQLSVFSSVSCIENWEQFKEQLSRMALMDWDELGKSHCAVLPGQKRVEVEGAIVRFEHLKRFDNFWLTESMKDAGRNQTSCGLLVGYAATYRALHNDEILQTTSVYTVVQAEFEEITEPINFSLDELSGDDFDVFVRAENQVTAIPKSTVRPTAAEIWQWTN